MGVPDRPSQGKHGSAGRAGGQGQPRDGVPPIKRYIPVFSNSLAPASLPKMEEEKEEDAEKFLGNSSSEKYLFPSGPITPNPPNKVFPSVVDLSTAGFQAQSSQDYLSCPPTMPPTLSKEKREGIFTEKYEKLVVSRPEDSSYSCTLSSLKVLTFQRVS